LRSGRLRGAAAGALNCDWDRRLAFLITLILKSVPRAVRVPLTMDADSATLVM